MPANVAAMSSVVFHVEGKGLHPDQEQPGGVQVSVVSDVECTTPAALRANTIPLAKFTITAGPPTVMPDGSANHGDQTPSSLTRYLRTPSCSPTSHILFPSHA